MKKQTSIRLNLLISGLSLFIMAILAAIAMGEYYPKLLNTAGHELKAANFYFTLNFISIAILDIIFAITFYQAFHSVNSHLKFASSAIRILYAIILIWGLQKNIVLVFSENYLVSIQDIINDFNSIWSFALILFGLHLILLSRIILNSQFAPKWLSHLLLLAGFLYAIHHAANTFFDAYNIYKQTVDMIIALPCALSELLLAFYCLKSAVQTQFFSDATQ